MMRKLYAALALALLAAVMPAGPANAADDPPVYIVNVASGRCLDAAAQWNGANGTPVQLWDCYPPTQYNQMWQVHWLTGQDFQLINVASGRCLDVTGQGYGADGTPLQLWDCLGLAQTNQVWHRLNTSTANVFWLQEQHWFKVADATAQWDGANGTPIQLWDRIGETQTNQLWAYKNASDF